MSKIMILIALITIGLMLGRANNAGAFGPTPADPFACPMLEAQRFDFDARSACGLAEDQAFDVWAYFNVCDWATQADYDHYQATRALSDDQIETWIVSRAALIWSVRHAYTPAMVAGETRAALDGLAARNRGLPVAQEWIDAYGRLLN